MIDIAIGVIIRASFNKVVDVFVNNIVIPPLTLLTGGINFTDKKIVLKEAEKSEESQIAQIAIALVPSSITFLIEVELLSGITEWNSVMMESLVGKSRL